MTKREAWRSATNEDSGVFEGLRQQRPRTSPSRLPPSSAARAWEGASRSQAAKAAAGSAPRVAVPARAHVAPVSIDQRETATCRGRFAASVGRETRRPVVLAVECRGSKAPHAAIASGLPGVIRACPIIMPAFPTGRDVPEFFIAEGDFVEDRFLSTGARARDLPSISQHSPDLGSRCSNRVPITEQKGAEWHEMKRNGGVGHYTHWGQPQSAGTSEKSNGFRREILIRANSD